MSYNLLVVEKYKKHKWLLDLCCYFLDYQYNYVNVCLDPDSSDFDISLLEKETIEVTLAARRLYKTCKKIFKMVRNAS